MTEGCSPLVIFRNNRQPVCQETADGLVGSGKSTPSRYSFRIIDLSCFHDSVR
jgi:hypothetical protein